MVITGELEYWNVTVQNEIENLTQIFENSSFISSSSFYTESWLRSFLGYAGGNEEDFNVTIGTPQSFISVLKEVSVETLKYVSTFIEYVFRFFCTNFLIFIVMVIPIESVLTGFKIQRRWIKNYSISFYHSSNQYYRCK